MTAALEAIMPARATPDGASIRQLMRGEQRDVGDVPLSLSYFLGRRPRQASSAPDKNVSALEADSASISGVPTRGTVARP